MLTLLAGIAIGIVLSWQAPLTDALAGAIATTEAPPAIAPIGAFFFASAFFLASSSAFFFASSAFFFSSSALRFASFSALILS